MMDWRLTSASITRWCACVDSIQLLAALYKLPRDVSVVEVLLQLELLEHSRLTPYQQAQTINIGAIPPIIKYYGKLMQSTEHYRICFEYNSVRDCIINYQIIKYELENYYSRYA